MNYNFTASDKKIFKLKGVCEASISSQIEQFKKGIPFLKISEPAVPNNGITIFDMDEQHEFIDIYDESLKTLSVLKFVPASGAASRMFKDMFSLRDKCLKNNSDKNTKKEVVDFMSTLPHFAFYKSLQKLMEADGVNLDNCVLNNDFLTVSDYILNKKGLNYAQLPKALILFHDYQTYQRTSLEEHLVEAALYCKNNNEEALLHFTISNEHETLFKSKIDAVIQHYSAQYNTSFNISYSFQKPSTDTVAVDMNNDPFRDDDGAIVFRPGGHGALIQNLNDCNAEMIFIKNIDNIVPDRLKSITVRYKKIIGGLLLKLKSKTHYYLHLLSLPTLTSIELNEISVFAKENLNIRFNASDYTEAELKDFLFEKLNRPLRVCGMVKNEGEPGGGPFWVEAPDTNEVSLQIVESSQIDMNNLQQKELIAHATHFNPVDLVCWTHDYKGQKFNLLNYIDEKTGFISAKSKDGRELKALELPGLWNGAMANWITVFVEIPLITFNPVKTTDDLLRIEHKAVME